MAVTYEPIATQTLASNGTFSFSSIPQTYTDLVISINAGTVTSASIDLMILFNGVSTTSYSQCLIAGTGTTASSTKLSNRSAVYLDYNGGTVLGINRTYVVNIMNYSNTTTYKTFINRASYADGTTELNVSTFRDTSAISSFVLTTNGYGILAGSMATLYGIKAA